MSSETTIPIIYWTTWFGMDQWEGYQIDHCGLPYKCVITHDRNQMKNNSILIFHASDINDLPETRLNQAWVYHNAEAPKREQDSIVDKMQYSMTYRLDSDFPWGYFDSSLLKELEKPFNRTRHKRKAPVAWIVSNCKAKNYRHHYVKELMKYIDIDIYGHCMDNQPSIPDDKSIIELISEYHFYLSFENSNCKDYVTEKLYNAYMARTIPVVDGPSDYRPFIPTANSVIRLDDFESPKQLAEHLIKVLSDKSLYNSYFDYENGITNKDFLATLETYETSKCHLCQLAYERYTNNPIYLYPGKKIYPDNTCIASKHYQLKYSYLSHFIIFLIIFIFIYCFTKFKRNSFRFLPLKK